MSTTATKALQRAMRILELLSGNEYGMSFFAICKHLELSDSVCSRLLNALQEMNYISKDLQQSRYLAGPALSLLHGRSTHDRLVRIVRPHLQSLCDQFSNTSLLIAYHNNGMHILDRCLHEDSMAFQEVGSIAKNFRHPPWGWLFKPLKELKRLSKEREEVTQKYLQQELQRLKTDGYVVRIQKDRRRIAVPLHDHEHKAFAAIAIGGTAISLADDDIPMIASALLQVQKTCQELLLST